MADESKSNGFNFPTAATAKCPYHVGIKEKSPHYHESGVAEKVKGPISKIYDTVLDHVGMTPMVRINHVGYEGDDPIQCELVAKCEYFNAGGSVFQPRNTPFACGKSGFASRLRNAIVV